jgi:hypothetical protein
MLLNELIVTHDRAVFCLSIGKKSRAKNPTQNWLNLINLAPDVRSNHKGVEN